MNFINTQIGKSFREWFAFRLKDINGKLRAKRAEIFAVFVKKTRINEVLDQDSLKALEALMYQTKVDKVEELLREKLPADSQDQYISLSIDWI